MGLLAKANAILEQEQKTAVATNQAPAKTKRPPKLRKLLAAFTLGLTMSQAPLLNAGNLIKVAPHIHLQPYWDTETMEKNMDDCIHAMGGVTNSERDMLAKMLYGEAGLGADPFEVLHTVLNRKASPLFKNKVADLLEEKDQYLGYRESNPVTPAFRNMVDLAIKDWEANDKQVVDDCHHFYFVTGEANQCNKFEVSQDPHGKWVPHKDKQYAKLRHYCPVAQQQAARYYQQYGHSNPRSM